MPGEGTGRSTDEDIISLALPGLAAGIDKIPQDTAKPLIERHLSSLEIPIYLYETYHAGQSAPEA